MSSSNFDMAIKSLSDIIKIDSVASEPAPGAPFGVGPRKALDYALDLLDTLGFRTKNGEGYYGYGEVGNSDLPMFGILAHLDVVPVSPNWKHAPFGAEVEGDRLYGRGTLDDKGPAIAAIYAVKELLDEGLEPKRRVRVILGCDEETGWRCMEHYQQNEETPVEGFSPDADFPVINCEKGLVCHVVSVPCPAGVSITSGTRSNIVPDKAIAHAPYSDKIKFCLDMQDLDYRVKNGYIYFETTGVSAHGSTPGQGVNAAIKALRILGAEYPELKKVYDAFVHTDGKGLGIDMHDDESGDLTLNLGIVKTEDGAINFTIDIRHPIITTKDELTARIQEAMPYAKVTQENFHYPLYVAKDDPLVKTLLDVYNEYTGDNAKPITMGGGTYAKMLPKGVAYGPVFPGEESLIHGDDEYISLTSFKKLISIYKEAIRRLCF